ncbi:MAG: hypothetical protein KAT46_04025 [Deltaproteobacteria bacterium]|nr:hypothetical protein [Deltaproteobacteria bacterium]
MSIAMEPCPYCEKQKKVDAMRCAHCGRILKTTEEQITSLRRFRARERKPENSLLRFIIVLAIAGGIIYYFRENLLPLIQKNSPVLKELIEIYM